MSKSYFFNVHLRYLLEMDLLPLEHLITFHGICGNSFNFNWTIRLEERTVPSLQSCRRPWSPQQSLVYCLQEHVQTALKMHNSNWKKHLDRSSTCSLTTWWHCIFLFSRQMANCNDVTERLPNHESCRTSCVYIDFGDLSVPGW